MYDNYHYPAGADTPSAPWNEVETPEHEFDVNISQTLERTATVVTNDYEFISECDEEGCYEEHNTNCTDWNEVLKDNDIPTPLRLIEILKEVLEGGAIYINERETKHLIEECNEWTAIDTYIEEI
jgi:hypothetical protein